MKFTQFIFRLIKRIKILYEDGSCIIRRRCIKSFAIAEVQPFGQGWDELFYIRCTFHSFMFVLISGSKQVYLCVVADNFVYLSTGAGTVLDHASSTLVVSLYYSYTATSTYGVLYIPSISPFQLIKYRLILWPSQEMLCFRCIKTSWDAPLWLDCHQIFPGCVSSLYYKYLSEWNIYLLLQFSTTTKYQ